MIQHVVRNPWRLVEQFHMLAIIQLDERNPHTRAIRLLQVVHLVITQKVCQNEIAFGRSET